MDGCDNDKLYKSITEKLPEKIFERKRIEKRRINTLNK